MSSADEVKRPRFRIIPNVEDQTIAELAVNETPETWNKIFINRKKRNGETVATDELRDISRIVSKREKKEEKECIPCRAEIFKAFHLTKLHKVKVVFIAQDPYPGMLTNGKSIATGLSFSVRKSKSGKIPQTAQNIIKELINSIDGFKLPKYFELDKWAEQGVLMLNQSLVTMPGEPDSFQKIWMGFIKQVIEAIDALNPNCIYVLMGNRAIALEKFIGRNCVALKTAHPSARASGAKKYPAFQGSDIFLKINKELVKQKRKPIKWQI